MQLANPASVYCEKRGGTSNVRSTTEGDVGVCVFRNGKECDEWKFYRGECQASRNGWGWSLFLIFLVTVLGMLVLKSNEHRNQNLLFNWNPTDATRTLHTKNIYRSTEAFRLIQVVRD